ncbi:hypothetical protein THAOC_31304 [Thalassiosira oceanica]|uniref:Saccharopine dehydrogenase NADP binding domain-containing protein n=1 Tax=Thalassiosira oceanica TaxID=159749 RepID=K0R8G7_THAOC|nr:hypothetical protein THAOC_31304 [Thalassiosira oceanica]|eukprot:EJK49788.1 hypothetical protein THAOC_31304 [Thalassiosira oceanica]
MNRMRCGSRRRPPVCVLLLSFIALPNLCRALNVLVVGGSGRVGGSTVRWLKTLSDRRQDAVEIAVGGRRRESFEAAVRNKIVPRTTPYIQFDLEDPVAVSTALQDWKASDDECLLVHTAGPFQGRTDPTLLRACIDMQIPYVDVCDEWDLAEKSKADLHQKAVDNQVPAIVSSGIWPGVSALMAAEGVDQLKSQSSDESNVKTESIDFSFFTAGTGNAGPTIVSATFLLLATPVITFINGKQVDVEPWTEKRSIDFGPGVGTKPVWLLDNPDVPTTALSLGKPNCQSRFGTDPNWSQVGATNAMRVDVTVNDGGNRKTKTLRIAHHDLEQCVGLATAAFALEVADSMREKSSATVQPGVYYPVELGNEARRNILKAAKEDAFVYEI